MLFSQLIGNTSIKEQIQRMVDSHTLPSVLLFHGPSGVGKRRFAEELALHLLRSSSAADRHPDLHQFFPDKNGLHSISSMRELIAETALPPYSAPAKVFIVHHAEKMLPTSSNALLKTLEEPPSATWMILLATDCNTMLPTILSRCSMFHFKPLNRADLTTYLETRYGKEASADKHSIHFAEGSLEKLEAIREKTEDPSITALLRILDAGVFHSVATWYENLQKLEDTLKEPKKDEAESVSGESKNDTRNQALLATLMYWVRDICLLQFGGSPDHIYHIQHRESLEKQAQLLKPVSFPMIYRIFEKAQHRLASNMRLVTVLEESLLRLSQVLAK